MLLDKLLWEGEAGDSESGEEEVEREDAELFLGVYIK
jgi:hypothetical protein